MYKRILTTLSVIFLGSMLLASNEGVSKKSINNDNVLSIEKLLEYIPKHIIWHFESAYKLYQAHYLDVVYEMDKISQALNVAGIKPVFLKGAGYIASRDNCYFGRLFADVDIYIPKNKIESIKSLSFEKIKDAIGFSAKYTVKEGVNKMYGELSSGRLTDSSCPCPR